MTASLTCWSPCLHSCTLTTSSAHAVVGDSPTLASERIIPWLGNPQGSPLALSIKSLCRLSLFHPSQYQLHASVPLLPLNVLPTHPACSPSSTNLADTPPDQILSFRPGSVSPRTASAFQPELPNGRPSELGLEGKLRQPVFACVWVRG